MESAGTFDNVDFVCLCHCVAIKFHVIYPNVGGDFNTLYFHNLSRKGLVIDMRQKVSPLVGFSITDKARLLASYIFGKKSKISASLICRCFLSENSSLYSFIIWKIQG